MNDNIEEIFTHQIQTVELLYLRGRHPQPNLSWT